MREDAKAADVAQYMLDQLTEDGMLGQRQVALDISEEFPDEFTYINQNGNLAISESVLRIFRELTEGRVIWERSRFFWRWREEDDPPGRVDR